MPSSVREHVVLTHVEVVGDVDSFREAWQQWIDEVTADAPGLIDTTLLREGTGRRLLLIQRWRRASDYDAWHASEAAQGARDLFDRYAVRSATSRWETGEGQP